MLPTMAGAAMARLAPNRSISMPEGTCAATDPMAPALSTRPMVPASQPLAVSRTETKGPKPACMPAMAKFSQFRLRSVPSEAFKAPS